MQNHSADSRPQGGHRRPARPKSEFNERVIQVDRVVRTVKGGRRMRFRATVVIGDGAGRIGFGVGKGKEVQLAVQKAVSAAKRGMFKVPLMNDTIPYPMTVKFKTSRLILIPAKPGTGVIAGGAVRTVMDTAGVKNILSKSHGSSNKLTTAQAAMKALSMFAARPTTTSA